MKHFALLLAAFLVTGCSTAAMTPVAFAAEHPEAKPYEKTETARADVDAALAQAKAEDKLGLIVMGANWCHDSRALAGWFETERFQTMLSENYVVEYIDVGQKNRNQDIAESFGLDGTPGTPTGVVVETDGTVLNLDTAPTWRNAASRAEDDIYTEFESFTKGR